MTTQADVDLAAANWSGAMEKCRVEERTLANFRACKDGHIQARIGMGNTLAEAYENYDQELARLKNNFEISQTFLYALGREYRATSDRLDDEQAHLRMKEMTDPR